MTSASRVVIAAAILMGSLIRPSGATSLGGPRSEQEVKAEAALAVYWDFRSVFGEFLPIGTDAIATLAAGAIESGKSREQMFELYNDVSGFVIARSPSDVGKAVLANAAAVTGKNPSELVRLWLQIVNDRRDLKFDSAAELAAAAAIEGKSPAEAVALFSEIQDAFGQEGAAILTAGGLRSRLNLEVFRIAYDKQTAKDYDGDGFFRLAAGAALSGLPFEQHKRLFILIRYNGNAAPDSIGSAALANAVLIMETQRQTVAARRVLERRIQPAQPGDEKSAEKVFELNWHGGF